MAIIDDAHPRTSAAPAAASRCPNITGYVLRPGSRPQQTLQLRKLPSAAPLKAVAAACDADPDCLAFTPDGWLYQVWCAGVLYDCKWGDSMRAGG